MPWLSHRTAILFFFLRFSLAGPRLISFPFSSFQLGLCEDKKSTFEDPSDADVHAVQVEEGDIILLATDGLFDNLEEAEIMRLVGDGSGEPRQLASTLADAAFKASVDTDKDGPFATLAKVSCLSHTHSRVRAQYAIAVFSFARALPFSFVVWPYFRLTVRSFFCCFRRTTTFCGVAVERMTYLWWCPE